jgi:hypothetical protein
VTTTASRIDDSVVVPAKPLAVTIPFGQASVDKVVKVKVVNADILPVSEVDGNPIQLLVHLGDCPPGTVVGKPDFDRRTPGDQDTVVMRGGRAKSANVRLNVSSAAFTSFNRITPTRCTLMLEVRADLPGSVDPSPDNNFAPLEINVIDRNDPDLAALHESAIDSILPLAVKLRRGSAPVQKLARPRVLNSNLASVLSNAISVSVTHNCPPGSFAGVDFDSRTPGEQNVAAVPPGGKVRGLLAVTASGPAFFSRNKKSPARCVATLTATGPSGDTDPSNNVTRLVLDVTDMGDF